MTTGKKQVLAGTLAGVALIVAAFMFWRTVRATNEPANYRVLMDSGTGDLVRIRLTADSPAFPHRNPKTGTMTLYPIERCFYGECGKSPEGTPVVLKERMGEPGPTLCPKCGHKVVMHNPRPRKTDDSSSEDSRR